MTSDLRPILARLSGVAIFAGLLLACGAPGAGSSPPPSGRRVAVIGWDGADWEIARPLMESGRMPALAGLAARGATAELSSMVPTLSPLLWTTVATGRPPEAHGVLDFLQPDPGGGPPYPVDASSRQVPSLWEMAAASGRSAGVVGWWATHPAQPLPGFMVSDRLAYTLLDGMAGAGEAVGSVQPEELADRATVVTPDDVPPELLDALLGPGPAVPGAEADLRRIVAAALTYQRATIAGLRGGKPDLLLAYFSLLDQVSHRFADCASPPLSSCPEEERARFRDTIEGAYELQDRLLGELLAALDPGTEILLLSDHGFLSGDRRPVDVPPDVEGRPGRWHRPSGLFVLAGPAANVGPIPPVDILDVAPTVLALLGLPAGEDMEGAARLDALTPRVRDEPVPEPISSWEERVRTVTSSPAPAGEAERRQVEQLRALGYLSGGGERAAGARTVAAEVNLASRLFQVGRLDEAAAALERALDRSPDYVPALSARAEVALRRGRRDAAAADLARAIERDGGAAADPQLLLRWVVLAGGRDGAAARAVDEAARLRPSEPDLLAASGMRLLDADPVAAAERFQRALAARPGHREALAGLFAAVEERGVPAGADLEIRLRRALEREPDDVMPRNWLALRLARDPSSTPEALQLLREARRLAPEHLGTLLNLGAVAGQAGEEQEALACFRGALRLDAADVAARVGLATTLARSGDLGAAREALEGSPAAARQDPRLLNTLALVHRDLGEADRAAEMLRSSLALRPDQPEVRRLLAALEGER